MALATNTEQSVDKLIRFISEKQLKVGDRLPSVKELGVHLGLAPHAVRDALLQAQVIGVVRVRPRSGSFVQSLNFTGMAFAGALPQPLGDRDRNLLNLLEARRVVEVELTGIAAARRRLSDLVVLRDAQQAMYENPYDYEFYMTQNEKFHTEIAKIAGNELLISVVTSLMSMLRPTLGVRAPANWSNDGSEKRRRDAAEHLAIFNALLNGDSEAARSAMMAHLQDTTESLAPKTPPEKEAVLS